MCIKKIRDGESVTIHSDKTKDWDIAIIFMLKMLQKQLLHTIKKIENEIDFRCKMS